MKRLICFLALCAAAFAQTAFRVDPTPIFTTPGQSPPGAMTPVFAVPGSSVSLCSNQNCTAQAITFTNGSGTTTCPANAQITLPGSSFCQSTTGPLGVFGFWVLSGNYWFTVTFPSGQQFGPYALTVGGTGSGSSAWSAITPGTNTLGAFLVGSGASISAVSGGIVNANVLNGVQLTGLPSGLVSISGGIVRAPTVADVFGPFSGCSGADYAGFDGACHAPVGGGTVSSVGMSVPSWLSVSGSPITTSGVLGITPNTGQASHLVIGTCGSATIFAPCALVAADIPILNQNTSGNAATATSFAGTPTLCTAGNAPVGILANGNATGCAPIGGGGGVSPGFGISITGSTVAINTAVTEYLSNEQAGVAKYCHSGTGNTTYTCAMNPTLTAYTTGTCLTLSADTGNTTTATLNVDTLGAKSILDAQNNALTSGAITANIPVSICYNGVSFNIQGQAVSGGGGTSPVIDSQGVTGNISCTTSTPVTVYSTAIASLPSKGVLDITGGYFYGGTGNSRLDVYVDGTLIATPYANVSSGGARWLFDILHGNTTGQTAQQTTYKINVFSVSDVFPVSPIASNVTSGLNDNQGWTVNSISWASSHTITMTQTCTTGQVGQGRGWVIALQ